MCLGSGARAANKAAMRNYKYQLAQRERNWMSTLGVTSMERVQYAQSIDASNVGLQNFYGDLQEKYGDALGAARQQDEANYKEYLQSSKGGKAAASARTGRSAARMEVLDFGEYAAVGSRMAYKLTQSQRDISKAGAQMAAKTRAEQMQLFAHNNIVKTPELAPPKPVMQNVAMASFMDALSIASSVAGIASGFGSLKTPTTNLSADTIAQIRA